MKIEKVIFHLPEAIRLASVRLGIRPLKQYEVLILYVIRCYHPIATNAIVRKIESFYHPIGNKSVVEGLAYLRTVELIFQSQRSYSISPLGREYLSLVRRYLLHKRI